ncbi:MAG: radical SAM protein [Bacteroidales bacterium]|nr:radical SAM protein [Bacteroidales bacterium]
MEAIYDWLNSLLNKNKAEFSQLPGINWANSYAADEYQNKRDALMKGVGDSLLFKATKPFYRHISKGCEICGSGKWSCLFITNNCNAGCFYCPAPQLNDEQPSTQGLEFNDPADYADYLNHFGFEGASFSGGEPLLYFDRTHQYLKTIRQKCRSDLYVWMYTNGILAKQQNLKALADASLDEIRFDIGATGFSLDKVRLAKGIIPNITIEIPSVPEEKDRLISLLPQMIRAGVTNLNLHHLRMTQHNARHLIKRGYTMIGAERPLVMESEMAALEIMASAKEMGLSIGINYCSFHFKNRFQKAGYRTIVANRIAPGSTITNNGYLREYDGDSISYQMIKLFNQPDKLPGALPVDVEGKKYFYSLIRVFSKNNLSAEYQNQINKLLENEPDVPPGDPLLFKIWQYEYIETGLRFF